MIVCFLHAKVGHCQASYRVTGLTRGVAYTFTVSTVSGSQESTKPTTVSVTTFPSNYVVQSYFQGTIYPSVPFGATSVTIYGQGQPKQSCSRSCSWITQRGPSTTISFSSMTIHSALSAVGATWNININYSINGGSVVTYTSGISQTSGSAAPSPYGALARFTWN